MSRSELEQELASVDAIRKEWEERKDSALTGSPEWREARDWLDFLDEHWLGIALELAHWEDKKP